MYNASDYTAPIRRGAMSDLVECRISSAELLAVSLRLITRSFITMAVLQYIFANLHRGHFTLWIYY